MFKKIMVGMAAAVILGVIAQGVMAAKIVFYTPSWGVEYAEEIIALYEEEKPDVKIELIRGPSTWDDHVARTSLWIRTKYPGVDVLYEDDVFTLNGAYFGVWEDLTPYLSEQEKGDLIGLQKEYAQRHGGIYRIPWWNGMSYMYYRKDLLAEEGVTVPDTWDEFLEVGKRLTRDLNGDGEIDQWGYVTQGTPGEMYNNFMEFLYQTGAEEWELAREGQSVPEAKKGLEFMVEVYTTIAPAALSAIGYSESRALFREGKVAMLRDWADMGLLAAQEGLTDVVGVMNFPAGPAGPYGIGHCWGAVVNKYGANFKKNKDVVIDFARFMIRPEIHKITAVMEGPALKSVLSDQKFMQELAERNIVTPYFEEFLKFRRVRNFPPGKATEYHEGIGRMVTRTTITGELTVEEGLLEIQKWIDPLIAEFKE